MVWFSRSNSLNSFKQFSMLIYSSNRRENDFTSIGWSHAEIWSCEVWPNLILKPVTRSTKGYSKFPENLVYRSPFFSVYCYFSHFVTPSFPFLLHVRFLSQVGNDTCCKLRRDFSKNQWDKPMFLWSSSKSSFMFYFDFSAQNVNESDLVDYKQHMLFVKYFIWENFI